MIYQLEKEILKATCSKSLLNAIEKSNERFDDFDLLILTYRYAVTYEKQMDLLRLILENTKCEKTKSQAEKCIAYKGSEPVKFRSSEKDCVFEVVVTEHQTGYKQKFLTKIYQVAVEKMKEIGKRWNKYEFEISQIDIIKRKVNDSVTVDDVQGTETYNEKLELIEINNYRYSDEKNWLCPNCNCWENDEEAVDNECFLHRKLRLPKFIKEMDLIKYKSYYDTLGTSMYAINLDWDDDDKSGYVQTGQNLCIPLDSNIYTMETEDELFEKHTHVEYVHIDVIKPSEVPADVRKMYKLAVKILTKNK